jgi:hypothetical protein
MWMWIYLKAISIMFVIGLIPMLLGKGRNGRT